jgi:hypothetical protein
MGHDYYSNSSSKDAAFALCVVKLPLNVLLQVKCLSLLSFSLCIEATSPARWQRASLASKRARSGRPSPSMATRCACRTVASPAWPSCWPQHVQERLLPSAGTPRSAAAPHDRPGSVVEQSYGPGARLTMAGCSWQGWPRRRNGCSSTERIDAMTANRARGFALLPELLRLAESQEIS